MIKISINLSNNKGATLVEAMVAVLILSLGLIPAFTVILLASNFSSTIKNNLIAANLAQEGVEVVRALRDENWLSGGCFGGACGSTSPVGVWIVQWDSSWAVSGNNPQPVGSNPILNLDTNGLYTYGPGVPTIFSRKVTITEPVPGVELMVIIEVSWPERNKTQTITAESHLYNWK